MREIKFRAWNKSAKEWHTKYTAVSCDGRLLTELAASEDYAPTPDADVILMQFTGLHDENGKGIYEGDLFNCMYHRDGHTDHRYSVIFNEFSAAFELQRHGPPCPQRQVLQSVRDHSGWLGEVIGNIYENPDLIPGV